MENIITLPIFQILLCLGVLSISCFSINKFLPDLPFNSYWCRTITSYSIILMGSGFIVRHDIPLNFSIPIFLIWCIFCVFIFNIINILAVSPTNAQSTNIKELQPNFKNILPSSIYLIVIIFTLAVFFFPEIIAKTIIIQNKGPDFDGHLLSAAHIVNGGTRSSLLALVGPQVYKWDSLVNVWDYPDFNIAVAFEFLWRCNRLAFAGLASIIHQVFPFVSVEIILLAIMAFSTLLTASLIFERSLKAGLFTSIFILGTFLFSQSLLLQKQEGIIAQLIALPIMTLILINIAHIDIKSNSSNIFLALLFSSLMQTFGEGALILGFIYLVYVFLLTVKYIYDGKENENKSIGISLCIFLLTLFLIDSAGLVDFSKWFIFRTLQGFPGGALNFPWGYFDVLFNLPYARVPAVYELRAEDFSSLSIIIFLLIPIALKVEKGPLKLKLLSLVCLLTPIIPIVLNQPYASWKLIVVCLPFLLIYLSLQIPRLIYQNTNTQQILAVFLCGISFWGYYQLSNDYLRLARRINLPYNIPIQFPMEKEFAFVTLQTDGYLFQKYGTLGHLYWLNSGWGPNFKKYGKENLTVYGLVDCINYSDACSKRNVGKIFYINLNKEVIHYVKNDGNIDLLMVQHDLLTMLKKD